ncbi:MAG: dihydroneopterin aldolase [Xanthomonadales bacterium]|nr:dihydroneopterin aldolase [Xanthomonadales bacterium]ODU92648.1 MAG: dihydroneopterin aldolase [Rhodanobacter sp. SCN 66-43]OJY85409.1 MAG: dihydroneopterin aldolase [Xanthomonadales bacterium 66-474]
MDSIFIEGLAVETLIGIHDGERDARQPLVVDLELGFDNTRPAASGRIEDTIDYAAVVDALETFVAESDCGLLEELAEGCCAMLRQKFDGLRSIDLRLDKPAAAQALGCRHVGVRIRRRFA